MRAGMLKSKIVIQQKAQIPDLDEAGQPVFDWIEVCSPRAHIKYLNGAETIRAGAESSTAKVSIRIRYRPGITNEMRVQHGATVYEIMAVLPDEIGREHLDLVCEVVS